MEAGIMNHSGSSQGKRLLVSLLALVLAVPVWADDTEIYFSDPPAAASAPLVMLSLDLGPSLSGRFCDKKNEACRLQFGGDEIGDSIYEKLGNPFLGIADGAAVSKVDALKAALIAIFLSDIPDDKKVGLMVSHAAGNNRCTTGSTGCSQGGYIMRGYELMGPDDPSTTEVDDPNGARAELVQIIKDLPLNQQGTAAHPYQGIGLFMEMYRYLSGQNVLHGKLGYTDFNSVDGGGPLATRGTPTRNLDYEFSNGFGSVKCAFTVGANSGDNRHCQNYITTEGYTLAAGSNLSPGPVRIPSTLTWDPTILDLSGNRYVKPGGQSCGTAYTINLLFGPSLDGGAANPNAVAATRSVASTPNGGLGLKDNPSFEQVISALKNFNQAGGQTDVPNVTSYFLTTGAAWGQVNPYAQAGGTKAVPALDDPRKAFDAIKGVFDQINSVSASYVAVTVPVNADNRVTSLPNLFVALFQVDENGRPYWPGNVKKLDIVESDPDPLTGIKTLSIEDANGAEAFNSATGRIKDDALTVWTCENDPNMAFQNTDKTKGPILISKRDGSAIRRGGAGQKMPGYLPSGIDKCGPSAGVGENNSATGARQIFIDPATVTGSATAGNLTVALDATSASTLLADTAIQDLLGIHATSVSATCPGRDVDNYCVTFINQVLTAAGQATTAATPDKASTATRLFLRWVRGYDVFNEAGVKTGPPWNGLTTTVQRKWLMGDVLHSRPVAVNYGARAGYGEKNQDVRLIFGANDGLLRMVRNTSQRSTKPTAVEQEAAGYGQEVWAFMPRELLANVPKLAMEFGNMGLNRPYGADGPPTLFTIDTNRDGIINNASSCSVGADNCDRAWIYFGLRRGGKGYYAVDVSNPDVTVPKLLWKIDSTMADFTELGLTFSTPRVGWVRFEDVDKLNQFGSPAANVPVPVVIFGGGYNGHAVTGGDHHRSGTGGPSKDTIVGTPFIGADTQGNAIYIVHARTGQLIWKATRTGTASATRYVNAMMQHGIAAPVSPMDSDGNGILDRLYVADTGGRVWRFDIPEYVPGISSDDHRQEEWKATVLADLRPADIATSTVNDLRFFHGATIVRRARDGIGVYDALYLGSGDREHPQSDTYDVTSGDFTTTVTKTNWFFLLKDRLTISGDPAVATRTAVVPGDLLDVTDACFMGSASASCSAADLSKGWRLKLEELGEKNLSEPFIGGEGVIFTTYLPRGTTPDDKACVPLGSSRLYQVSLDTGAPLPFLRGVAGDTFSKTDRWINLYSGIDGGVVAVSPDFWITATGKSGSNPPQKPVRFYWRESGVDAVK